MGAFASLTDLAVEHFDYRSGIDFSKEWHSLTKNITDSLHDQNSAHDVPMTWEGADVGIAAGQGGRGEA